MQVSLKSKITSISKVAVTGLIVVGIVVVWQVQLALLSAIITSTGSVSLTSVIGAKQGSRKIFQQSQESRNYFDLYKFKV